MAPKHTVKEVAKWRRLASWSTRHRQGEETAAAGLDQLQPASRRQRLVRVTLIALAVVAICGYLDQVVPAFDYLEQKASGERLKVYTQRNGSLAERAKQKIVLVTLSDKSFEDPNFLHLGGPPVPRDYHAKVVRELTRAGAKVIAFDFIFDLPRPQDKDFAAAAKASGQDGKPTRVLWACLFEDAEQRKLVRPNTQLWKASPHLGHIRVPQDDERPAVDRVEPIVLYRGKPIVEFGINTGDPIPSLSLEATRMYHELDGQRFQRLPDGWQIGDLFVPTGRDGAFKISYLGGVGETFPEVPYEHIYNGAVDDEMFRQNKFFQDKIVLIGDTTKIHHDYRLTPEGQMPGVEIHAHAVATLLQRGFIREAPPWINIASLCSMAVLACLMTTASRLRWAMLLAPALLFGYLLLNVWLFVDHGISLHLVAPCITIFLVTLGILVERGLTEEREKTRMRGLLQRYVSPQIAEYVVAHPEKCILGGEGERVTATVLFSDIRGFTALSEQLTPEQLVGRLNEYFQAMTDVVFKHDGATARFVGDAMMALFGVPVPHADHARRAVATAIDMQNALLELQEKWRARGVPLFDIGIGINTGEMAAGIVGAQQRYDFTVHGPQVNLAARVESLNKEFGSRILITESTYQFVKDEVEVREPVSVHVKGLEEAVVVYEVFGWRAADEVRSTASVKPISEVAVPALSHQQ